MTSRPRPTSQLPRAPSSISSTAILDPHAVLTGSQLITIGPSTVLHPRARLNSLYGPITLASGVIIHSRASIGVTTLPSTEADCGDRPNSNKRAADDAEPDYSVTIHANVVIEPGASVAAAEVGEGSVIGAGAEIQAGAVLGRNCRVAPLCVVGEGEVLPDGTVVYGSGKGQRRVQGKGPAAQSAGRLEELRQGAHGKQVEGLRRLIKSDLAKFGGAVAME